MKIAIGSDHAGYELKDSIMKYLAEKGIQCENLGGFKPDKMDYPVAGRKVAEAVVSGQFDKGIIICGTGVGISIAANKVPGARAVVCSEPYSAKMSRAHNDANILALGERVIGEELAIMILETWLETEFEGGRHAERVNIMKEIEKDYSK